MSDIIHLLPDSVANQIAAGEVIQRPASVIKELIENSIDSGADEIKIIIKDAGRTFIQVIDNGKGMSETDARMAFERHATSKISKAEDLFSIRTMGFRGEALASIAAIAQVELKTKQTGSELGTYIIINGSEIEKQETVTCQKGTIFTVKNLFYNIPARRKFLKANSTEFGHIETEFLKTALTQPNIAFTLIHNDTVIYTLHISNLRQRITSIFGKNFGQYLIPIEVNTSIINIVGYLGKPEIAKKTKSENYFFVNNRYMRHSYLHKAVSSAYEQIIPGDSSPVYFLYFDINPDKIDINIHPQKTEINFENTHEIFQILRTSVKEALGKFNIAPSIDFDQEGSIEIPSYSSSNIIKQPEIEINPYYNPFDKIRNSSYNSNFKNHQNNNENIENWEDLYNGFEKNNKNDSLEEIENEPNLFNENQNNLGKFIQIQNKYIVTPVKSGLMFIHQKRAKHRILYEKYLESIDNQQSVTQQLLYPENIEMSQSDFAIIETFIEDLKQVGFDISIFGKHSIIVNGIPSYLDKSNPTEIISSVLGEIKTYGKDLKIGSKEKIALILAKSSTAKFFEKLNSEEMSYITDNLFACKMPNFSPDGKTIISIIGIEEIEKKFK